MTVAANTNEEQVWNQTITTTNGKCPIGETTGQRAMDRSAVPVLSCEGACIRGEIARWKTTLGAA